MFVVRALTILAALLAGLKIIENAVTLPAKILISILKLFSSVSLYPIKH